MAEDQVKTRAEQIAEHYPKIVRKPGRGMYVCKKCGLANSSKNPWMRSSFICDEFVGQMATVMCLEVKDDPGRPAATNDNLRGRPVSEEEADYCMFEDYRTHTQPWREWVDKHHKEKTYSGQMKWVGGYVEHAPDPYVFYDQDKGIGREQGAHVFKKWVKLQTEPEKDLVLRMSIFPGQTREQRAKSLIERIRDIPEDRIEQVICHLFNSHEWEGKSEI
jgi:hypothetical protein